MTFSTPLASLREFFDMRRVYAPVHREPGERTPCDFAPDRVEARDGHRLGRIVHDHIHAGCLLEGADVAPVSAHDAALHLLIGERDDSAGHLGDMLGSHPLDGIRDQLAGALFALLAGLCFDLPDDAGHIAACLFLHFVKENLAGLVAGQLRHLLKLEHLIVVELLDFACAAVHGTLALVESLLALVDLLEA
jgi:hypothetical protein